MLIDLVVLDVAGTTVQEYGAVYDALREAVRGAGVAVAAEDVGRWTGADKREAIAALLATNGHGEPDRSWVERVHADFRRRLDIAYRDRPPAPLPGVPDALATLRSRGVKIALTTGFDRSVTQSLLGKLGWDAGVVDAVVCADDVAAGRPAPYMIFRAMEATGVLDVARVLAAGDTVLDLRAGVNAGVAAVVGVLTGAATADVLGQTRHTHLLDSVARLPALIHQGDGSS